MVDLSMVTLVYQRVYGMRIHDSCDFLVKTMPFVRTIPKETSPFWCIKYKPSNMGWLITVYGFLFLFANIMPYTGHNKNLIQWMVDYPLYINGCWWHSQKFSCKVLRHVLICGWWFGRWILFSNSYMGCHPSHWLIFFKMDGLSTIGLV